MRCQSTRLASFLLRILCVILFTTPVLGRAAPGHAEIPDQTAPLAASDAPWDDRFTGPPGPDGPVTAIAASGNEVFVGGSFATVGKLQSGPVAHWSAVNNAWFAMGDGLRGCSPLPCYPADPEVYAIAASGANGNDVYVGGRFAKAGAVAANHIAHWNGVAWSALGIGVDGPVQAIAIHGSDVYVGGAFQHAGGLTANGIARWNAATGAWSSLAGGFFNGDVSAIAVDSSGVVYAGG